MYIFFSKIIGIQLNILESNGPPLRRPGEKETIRELGSGGQPATAGGATSGG